MKTLLCTTMLLAFLVTTAACRAADNPGPQKGDKVIDFTLKTLDGKELKTADFRKGKAMLLKFGATWCGWCNKEIPALKKVQTEYVGKVALLDIDVNEEAGVVREHAAKNKTNYVTVLDTDGAVAKQYGVEGIPVVIIAGKDGTIAYRGYYTPYEDLKKVLDALLKE